MSKKNTGSNTALKRTALCAAIIVPCFAASLGIAAFLYSSIDFDQSAVGTIAVAFAAAGCFAAALFVVKYLKSRGMIAGAAIGAVIFIMFMIYGLVLGEVMTLRALYKLAIFVCSGALGGSIGVLKPQKTKKRRAAGVR